MENNTSSIYEIEQNLPNLQAEYYNKQQAYLTKKEELEKTLNEKLKQKIEEEMNAPYGYTGGYKRVIDDNGNFVGSFSTIKLLYDEFVVHPGVKAFYESHGGAALVNDVISFMADWNTVSIVYPWSQSEDKKWKRIGYMRTGREDDTVVKEQLRQDAITARDSIQSYIQSVKDSIQGTLQTELETGYEQPYTQAQTQAYSVKFDRENAIQNLINQRRQQSLYSGTNYLAGLR